MTIVKILPWRGYGEADLVLLIQGPSNIDANSLHFPVIHQDAISRPGGPMVAAGACMTRWRLNGTLGSPFRRHLWLALSGARRHKGGSKARDTDQVRGTVKKMEDERRSQTAPRR